MKIATSEIIGVEAPPAGKAVLAPSFNRVSSATSSARPSALREINVIGQTVEQATQQVDKFLDDAALAHLSSVRIIHGHGTGALRKGLSEFLRSHPLVATHSVEAEERGGKAITVVELRQ